MKYLIRVVILFACVQAIQAQNGIKNVLVLGDSHLKGYFGEYFHKKLHETGKYDILSIAIGGAGTKNFVLPLQNTCCGYKVRLTCAGDPLPEKGMMPALEKAELSTSGLILKRYGSKLSTVLQMWKPDVLIIALGSNYINAHQDLLSLIQQYDADMPIVWVGPFKRKNVSYRYTAIQKAIDGNGQCFLVRSDDIVGHDTLSSAHFVGKTAQKWAYTVIERFEPYLDSRFCVPSDSLSR